MWNLFFFYFIYELNAFFVVVLRVKAWTEAHFV